MGMQSGTNPLRRMACLFVAAGLVLPGVAWAQTAGSPLILPSGLIFDTGGNLYFAESAKHVVRRLTPSGVLTVVAGTGTQGFGGDGGLATAALLDSPEAVALNGAGDLFVADTHNHCVRRVDAVTGLISTVVQTGLPVALAMDATGRLVVADAGTHRVIRVDLTNGTSTVLAGSGVQGYSGDGGLATAAAIDTPWGLAFDGAGDLFLADAHNHRVRRVDAGTGVITTVAGVGVAGFSGDGVGASAAALALPRGLVVDGAGNLFVADSGNHRIRRVDRVTGMISSVAGVGVQGFAGDGGAAVAAEVASPRGVALSGDGLVTLADRGNGRLRQVDAKADLQTIAGVGAVTPARVATMTALTQSGVSTLVVAVSSGAGAPGGSVTLMDANTAVGTATLSAGATTFSTAGLSAGSHTMTAVYAGGVGFLPSTSAALIVTVGGASAADFLLASSGASAMTISAGSSAVFSFLVTPTGGALSSQIQFAASGLPAGAMATFAPAYLPPPNGPTGFTMTVSTAARAGLRTSHGGWGVALATLLPLFLLRRRRRGFALLGLVMLAGCGDRVNTAGEGSAAPVSYNITVNATGTSAAGGTLLHSAVVVLTVQ